MNYIREVNMKEVKLATKPIMLEDKNIKTIDISLIYPFLFQEEDAFNYDIMINILNNHSAAYPNEKEFSVEVSKRLIIHYRASLRTLGENAFIRFDLTIPKKDITPEYDLEEAIKFFKDTIAKPFAKDGKFDEKTFEREREYILARMEDSNNNNIYAQSFNRFIKVIDPKEEVFISLDTDLQHLKDANAKRSYNLYKEIVLSSDPLIYVFGNYEEKEIISLLEKYFPSKNKDKCFELKYDRIFHPETHEYVEEKSKFNQTSLFMLYDCKNIKPEEKEYLSLIGNILGGSENDLIFKQLRLYNNLVYSSNVAKYNYNGLILIETHLNYANKDRAIELIKETFTSLKDKKFLEEAISKLLKGIEVDMLRQSDSKYGVLVNKIDNDLQFRTLEHIYDCYKSMKIDDILAFLERINLNTIYVLRGENND